jgi:two-component system sensor histidine kinase PilS (NtrC family)
MREFALPAVSGGATDTADSLWRSLSFFNLYRLVAASVFLLFIFYYRPGPGIAAHDRALFLAVDAVYWVLALGFIVTHRRLPLRFSTLLTVQVLTDIVVLTLLLYASGGQKSGLAVMLLVVLAGAGLVGHGRMSLFYAAMATLALLLEQGYRSLASEGSDADFVQVGIISMAFFATAASARLLARRVIAHEELARSRGAALADQLRVNQRIIRDVHDGVLVLDPLGSVRQSNPQAETLLGLGALAGRNAADLLPELAEQLRRFGTTAGERAMLLRFAPGGRSLRARLVGAGGDTLVFLEDMGRLQAQAQQMKLAALGRLTANIAHEIRNPLSAISHAAELLREEKRADMQQRLTRIIRDNSQRLDRMVRDVLDLGRRDRIEPEQIALQPFLATFLDEFCMHEKVAPDLFDRAADDGATLVFDRAHFNQVLWNLLGNAVRYCSGGAAAIRLRAEVSAAANRCELHIIDDGSGIDETLRGQVFEPFFTTHSKGTGLGLYIARELCEANGATLTLRDNAPGAHFCITGKYRKWELETTGAAAPS